MMKRKSSRKIMAVVLGAAFLLTACAGKTEKGNTADVSTADTAKTEAAVPAAEAPEAEAPAAEQEKEYKVAYLTPGGTGDNGFTDSVVSGIDRIAADFGAKTTVVECNNDASKYAQAIEQTFQWNPDVVFADAYGFEELYAQYADKYPDVDIINLDFALENEKKTISYVTFINEEGSFLAGALAAIVSTSDLEYADADKIIGFMGGKQIPVIESFQYGFEQGAKYVDPDIKVVVTYTGDFFDPVKGKQAAKQLFAQGADVVFQAAGRTGIGALEAASEENKYAIGVDSNQNGLYPGFVISSMVKDLGGASYNIFKEIHEGTYQDGTHFENGAGEGGVYMAIDENSDTILGNDIIQQLKDIEQKIVDKEIIVEKYKTE